MPSELNRKTYLEFLKLVRIFYDNKEYELAKENALNAAKHDEGLESLFMLRKILIAMNEPIHLIENKNLIIIKRGLYVIKFS